MWDLGGDDLGEADAEAEREVDGPARPEFVLGLGVGWRGDEELVGVLGERGPGIVG